MIKIDKYTDFRAFLCDWYAARKGSSRRYSYRAFSANAGLKSPSIFKEVADGKRNLTGRGIRAFCTGLGLDSRDARYFENLVRFNQARTEEQRRKYLANLRGMRYRTSRTVIPVHLYEYYEEWYHPVIRELAVSYPWNGDYAKLASAVSPRIKKSEARKSIAMQVKLGFLRKNPDGTFEQTNPHITTGPEVTSLAVRKVNREYGRMGIEAIDRFAPEERDITSMVMGLTREEFLELKDQIVAFRKRIVDRIAQRPGVERVYNLVIQFFPLSADFHEKGREDA